MLKFKCKYVNEDTNQNRHFYFKVQEHENPTIRAKEILQDHDVNYSNIILKMEM